MKSSHRLFRFLRPYWLFATLGPLAMVCEVALDLLQPRLVQLIIDRGIANNDLGYVWHTLVWMGAITLGGLVMGALCAILATIAAQNFGADLRQEAFTQLQLLSFRNLDALDSGSLITRLSNDVRQVQDLVMTMLRFMVRAPLLMVGGMIMAILTSPRLGVLFLLLVPVILAILVVIVSRTFPLFGVVQAKLDALNTVVQENLSGVRVVKAFARQNFERSRFQSANAEFTERSIAAVRLGSLTNPLMTMTLNCGIIAALYFGGVNVKGGTMAVGEVVAFINYLFQSLMALMRLSVMVIQMARSEASAQRVEEMLNEVPAIPAAPETLVEWPNRGGEIRFQNVTFAYRDDDEPVLKDITFTVPAGQTTAVLGATGAGKSTLALLAARFYDVSAGRVSIDGVDVRHLSEEQLRSRIGVALQTSVLFSGTIGENVAYAQPDVPLAEIERAASLANASEFIEALPDGYDSRVGQRGVNLSGGQKQRLAIARALLSKPQILILDDSTSAVDVRTEAQIHAAIREQEFSQTRLIVAQRISTVRDADEILVLEDGEIAARGSHFELLECSELYREIYESQEQGGVIEQEIA
ncbi:putative ABC transporter ATP-binding protein [Abditibacteriota bacterium]|nr:putative ABC transporter ATP-binding protein [Abditibacteriota bacterium]